MNKEMLSAYAFLVVLATTGCSASTSELGEDEKRTQTSDTVSLIADPRFERGLSLKRADPNQPSAGVIHPFAGADAGPVWEIAEWGSKYLLSETDKASEQGAAVYANTGKRVRFSLEKGVPQVSLDILTSAEYERPRRQNEAWPHLLVEQTFPEKPLLKDLKGLILKLEGKLDFAEMKMNQQDFDPGLHAAQFQLFITVQNLNPNSPYYGDYLWFGVPFYDVRNEILEVYAAQDVGKGDATGKFIYSIGTRDYMEGTFHSKEWIKIEKDIYPLILKALEVAKERGYLTGTFFNEFRISGMNLGWEVPGTFDAGFTFRGFDLLAIQ